MPSTIRDDDDRVFAILYAAIHGDAAAAARYQITARTLRGWRAQVRDESTSLHLLYQRYGQAMWPDGRVADGADLDAMTVALLQLFLDKAQGVNPANPEGLRAIGEAIGSLLDQKTAQVYIARLFGEPSPAERDDDEAN